MLLISGASITAYCGTCRHIVVLEEDMDIFNAIIKPMMKSTPVITTTQLLPLVAKSQNLNAMTMVPCKFA